MRRRSLDEDFDAYRRRLRGYVKGRDPRPILRRTPGAIARRIGRASRRKLGRPKAPGKWSAGEILAHLADMELLWGYRMRTILEKSGVPLAGMDQEAWAKNARYASLDPRGSLEMFRALRRSNLELTRGLPAAALRRHGTHSQFGRITVAGILELLAGHDINHSRQLDAILRSRGRAARRPR
jgi:uncharacterized damage-inducible protein DinB